MRLSSIIGYGTERYPEKVARRLRAFNITAWVGALIPLTFAVLRLLDPAPGMVARGLVNASYALVLALLPLLNRFSPLAGPLTLVAFSYAFIFRVVWQVGTAGGSYFTFLTASALGLLFLGTERVWLTALIAAVAIGLVITLHVTVPPNTGLLSPSALFYGNFLINVTTTTVILYTVVFYALRQMERAEGAAEREHARSESLLANILPQSVAARLKAGSGAVIADSYDAASVLFADMEGFTARATDTAPDELVRFLDGVFTKLDGLVERHGLEKIKTTGDAYMVVSGVPEPRPDHAVAIADLALDFRDALSGLLDPRGRAVPVRIGIASGPVVAGVVGTRKFFYDVWGDAVNTASRMETTDEAGRIQVAPETYALIKGAFELKERGLVDVRGKGPMRTWFLVGRKASTEQAAG
jgi:adenylate cyclase